MPDDSRKERRPEGHVAPGRGLRKKEIPIWKNVDDVEYATLEWVDWFNNRRLLEPIGDVPPAEYEADYWMWNREEDTVGLKELSLH